MGPDQPIPTVLLHASVSHESTETEMPVDITVLMEDLETRAFGETVIDALTPVLTPHGVDLRIDTDRAKLVQDIDWSDVWSVRVAPLLDSLTAVSTAWTDPRGANISGLSTDHLFRRTEYTRIAKTLNPEGRREGYLFAIVRVTTETRWLVIRLPQVRVTVFVADENGREVLRAQGVGQGRSRLLAVDRSKDNLIRGLRSAMRALERAAVRPLRGSPKKNGTTDQVPVR
jgi:hypothetical protein